MSRILKRAYFAQERAARLKEKLADELREQIGRWLAPKYADPKGDCFKHRLANATIEEITETDFKLRIYDGGGDYFTFTIPVKELK